MAQYASGNSCTVDLISKMGAECAFQARVIKDACSQEVLQHGFRANQFTHLGANRRPERIFCVLGVCKRKCIHHYKDPIVITTHIIAETYNDSRDLG